MKTVTQNETIENLYNAYMVKHGSKRPIDHNQTEVLAALAATADLAKDKFFVTHGFKSGMTFYNIGDVYPVTQGDRAQVIKLCRTGYILPSEEYQRGLDYGAAKEQAEKIKNLYQALNTARDNKIQTARKVDAARLELVTAEELHSGSVQNLARIESDLLKELE